MMRRLSIRMPVPPRLKQCGMTLVELMIACTLGLLIVLVMSYIMVNSLQSRNELANTSRQIENGRYAMDELRKEVQLAGFYGSYFPTSAAVWTTPDPCATTQADLGFSATMLQQNVPVGLQGYTETDTSPTCISNRLAGTDVLVVRRTITEAVEIDVNPANDQIDSGIDATTLGDAFYLQVSNCPDLAMEPAFALSNASNLAAFSLHKVTPVGTLQACTSGHRSEIRRYTTHLFYVSSCNNCDDGGDDIPTLKMVEVSPTPAERPLAEGIQNLQIEYGFDTTGDGTPDIFETTIDAGPPARQWQDVVAVKVFLLARNLDQTAGHEDAKTYLMGSDGSTVGPFNDRIRRQAYVTTTMAQNIAGRRQQ